MGVSYYVSLESLPDQAGVMDGKHLARSMDQLNALSADLGIASLEDFLGQSGDELEDLLGDELDFAEPLEEVWFEPAEGLQVARELYSRVAQGDPRFEETEGLLEDLSALIEALSTAEAARSRWRLSIDF